MHWNISAEIREGGRAPHSGFGDLVHTNRQLALRQFELFVRYFQNGIQSTLRGTSDTAPIILKSKATKKWKKLGTCTEFKLLLERGLKINVLKQIQIPKLSWICIFWFWFGHDWFLDALFQQKANWDDWVSLPQGWPLSFAKNLFCKQI